MERLYTTWYGILIICLVSIIVLFIFSALLYRQFFKRFYDILLSFIAIVVLSPLFIILMIVGAIAMKGNPFFTQLRPGKKKKDGNERILKLIKFRTMSNKKDPNGNLLPDDQRLNKYGKFLRSTSLDELPELFNVLIGTMSLVGPRPLLVEYLPWYTSVERKRHLVRPGITGWAQIHGRNDLEWTKRFEYDVYYVENFSLFLDIRILIMTVVKVLKKDNIQVDTNVSEGNMADIRKKERGDLGA